MVDTRYTFVQYTLLFLYGHSYSIPHFMASYNNLLFGGACCVMHINLAILHSVLLFILFVLLFRQKLMGFSQVVRAFIVV